MKKYAKVINEETRACQVGVGTDTSYYEKLGMEVLDVEKCEWNGAWYLKGYCPEQPQDEAIKNQIAELEKQITERNLRGAILGDEFALNKITQIEEQIEELRKQLGE